MNSKLAILSRQMERRQTPEQAPVPADGHGLGAAIEKLIADEVERRVGDAMEDRAKQPTRIRQLFNAPEPVSDYRQLPPVPRAVPPTLFNATIHRDGAGNIGWLQMSDGTKFAAIRDRAGKMIEIRQVDESPVPFPVGEPR